VQAEGSGRVSKLAMKDPGSITSPPSSITLLTQGLLFLGSWLGHSNLVSFSFEAPDLPPASSPTSLSTATAAAAAGRQETETVGSPVATAGTGDAKVELKTEGGTAPDAREPTAAWAPQTAERTPRDEVVGTGALADTDAWAPTVVTSQVADVGSGEPGLGSLVEQMERVAGAAPASPELGPLTAASGSHKRANKDAPSGASNAPGEAALTPALKRHRSDNPLTTSPLSAGILPGLPFGGMLAAPVAPGLGGGIPGLMRVSSPREKAEVEAPMEDDGATLLEDHDDLEESLYQCATPLSRFFLSATSSLPSSLSSLPCFHQGNNVCLGRWHVHVSACAGCTVWMWYPKICALLCCMSGPPLVCEQPARPLFAWQQ
jgi:hypothetical protein